MGLKPHAIVLNPFGIGDESNLPDGFREMAKAFDP